MRESGLVEGKNIIIERRGDPEHPVSYKVSNDAAAAVRSSVVVYPGDTIVVPKAGIVYVLGDVNRPGGIERLARRSLSRRRKERRALPGDVEL